MVGGREGGANSRDINSVLALGGLQGRKLRWLGGGQPSSVSHPPRLSLVSPSPIPPPPPPPPSFTPCVDVAASAATPGCDSGAAPPPPSPQTVEEPAGGVTNQRLAIVNSTCAVKQLINKRLFTSCARSCFTRFIIIRVPRNEWRRGKRRRERDWPPFSPRDGHSLEERCVLYVLEREGEISLISG